MVLREGGKDIDSSVGRGSKGLVHSAKGGTRGSTKGRAAKVAGRTEDQIARHNSLV